VLSGAAVAAALVWAAGFFWFVHTIGHYPAPPVHTDGIVALTGGAERVETALRLLAAGKADRLLLSGIGGGAELDELAHLAGVNPTPLAARVTLGRDATSTRGNAAETDLWAQANHIRSLLVVTAYYHMPRALTELGRALDDVKLYPYPVLSPETEGAQPSRHFVPWRVIVAEYTKFLLATAGVSALTSSHAAPVTHMAHGA
jgi:uncharacterized SAM-binding protein YcdF (DUF218 family)